MTRRVLPDGNVIDDHCEVHGRIAQTPPPSVPPPRIVTRGAQPRTIVCPRCTSHVPGFACGACGREFHVLCGRAPEGMRVERPGPGDYPRCPHCAKEGA